MALTSARTRDRPVLRVALAAVFLAMAAGQLSDLVGFADILREYRVIPGPLVPVAAVVLPALEAAAGVGMLRRSPAAATIGLVVVALWSVLAVQGFSRGLALDNCGCFGVHLGQPLRWWVLLEDAEWALLMVVAWRSMRVTPRSATPGGIHDAAGGFPVRAGPLGASPHRPTGDGLRRR